MLTEAQKKQGSAEWLALRKTKITASDIPIIMGVSEYMTPYQLWEQKVGFSEPTKTNKRMSLGHDYEILIRNYANQNFGCNFVPDVVVHNENDLFMASLDGIDRKFGIILEAKLCKVEIFEQIEEGKYPEHFMFQIQMSMSCAEVTKCLLGAYSISKKRFNYSIIYIDHNFVSECIIKGKEFKKLIDDFIPPPLVDKDTIRMSKNMGVV